MKHLPLFTNKKILCLHFSLVLSLATFSQPEITDSSLILKPYFILGETRTYRVTQEYKMDSSPIFPIKAESEFLISFHILDTTGGYTIEYSVKTVKASNQRWELESLKAAAIDGVTLLYTLTTKGWVINPRSYYHAKKKFINRVDSIINNRNFNEDERAAINFWRKHLETNTGLDNCLQPLLIFNDIFTKPAFRKRKDFTQAYRMDIFHQPRLPGVLVLELKKIDTKNNVAKISFDFVGNRDSAAKYFAPLYQTVHTQLKGKPSNYQPSEMKNNSDRQYEIMLANGWPIKINSKEVEFYVEKVTYKTTMTLVGKKS